MEGIHVMGRYDTVTTLMDRGQTVLAVVQITMRRGFGGQRKVTYGAVIAFGGYFMIIKEVSSQSCVAASYELVTTSGWLGFCQIFTIIINLGGHM